MKRVFLMLLVVSLIISGVTSVYGAETIKVGLITPLTGPIATFGQSVEKGVRMAVDEINAKGGVLGMKIELFVEDNQAKAEESANIARKFIEQNKVVAILGPVISSNTLAAAPIAQQSKVPLLSPTATNPRVTQVGNYIFRACFVDDFQGTVMARFARTGLGKRLNTAAILYEKTSDYSIGLAKYFKETFISLGGKIVAEESFSSGDQDFSAQLTKIKGKNPDVLYVPSYYDTAGLIIKQARELGINVPILGGDGFDSPQLAELAGKENLKNCYFSGHFFAGSKSPEVRTFVANYKKRYNAVPDMLAALGYDAVYMLADAIKRAGKVDRDAIRDALANTKNLKLVTGTITLDENRNPKKSAVIVGFDSNGNQVYKTTVNPPKK
ncbi:ABC transporter substrate-binding protein [bacterium]|nr:ABC transporter substrate-binding protein [bacterium]